MTNLVKQTVAAPSAAMEAGNHSKNRAMEAVAEVKRRRSPKHFKNRGKQIWISIFFVLLMALPFVLKSCDNIDSELMREFKTLKDQCPIYVGNGTTVTDVNFYENEKILEYIGFIDGVASLDSVTVVTMRQAIIENLINFDAPVSGEFNPVQRILKDGYRLRYIYTDEAGNKLCDFDILKDDLLQAHTASDYRTDDAMIEIKGFIVLIVIGIIVCLSICYFFKKYRWLICVLSLWGIYVGISFFTALIDKLDINKIVFAYWIGYAIPYALLNGSIGYFIVRVFFKIKK